MLGNIKYPPYQSFVKLRILYTFMVIMLAIVACAIVYLTLNEVVSVMGIWALSSPYSTSYDPQTYTALFSIFGASLFFVVIGLMIYGIIQTQRQNNPYA